MTEASGERERMDLYDSDTGETLFAQKRVDLADDFGEPVSLLYTRAKRGRICQVRRGKQCSVRIHYFYDDAEGQRMIAEDEDRNGVSLSTIRKHAPQPGVIP